MFPGACEQGKPGPFGKLRDDMVLICPKSRHACIVMFSICQVMLHVRFFDIQEQVQKCAVDPRPCQLPRRQQACKLREGAIVAQHVRHAVREFHRDVLVEGEVVGRRV